MRRLINKFGTKVQLWFYRRSQVGEFDGIRLADLLKSHRTAPAFRDTLLAALRLLKDTDRRRFNRVRKYLSWVAHVTLWDRGRAQYEHATRTCAVDFIPPSPEYDAEWLIGWYACVLVHEATHGLISSRGIAYSQKLRLRIEHLCVTEEQRFLLHLTITQPNLAERLYREFDASQWKESFRQTRFERFYATMRRILFAK